MREWRTRSCGRRHEAAARTQLQQSRAMSSSSQSRTHSGRGWCRRSLSAACRAAGRRRGRLGWKAAARWRAQRRRGRERGPPAARPPDLPPAAAPPSAAPPARPQQGRRRHSRCHCNDDHPFEDTIHAHFEVQLDAATQARETHAPYELCLVAPRHDHRSAAQRPGHSMPGLPLPTASHGKRPFPACKGAHSRRHTASLRRQALRGGEERLPAPLRSPKWAAPAPWRAGAPGRRRGWRSSGCGSWAPSTAPEVRRRSGVRTLCASDASPRCLRSRTRARQLL